MNTLLFFALILTTQPSCKQNSNLETEIPELESLIKTFSRNFQNQDIDSLKLSIHKDVRFYLPGIGLLNGQHAFSSYFKKEFQKRSYSFSSYPDTIYLANRLAIYREEQNGQIDDLESGMSYPFSRYVAYTCIRDSMDAFRIFECSFVEKD
jgi:hypothetical protein